MKHVRLQIAEAFEEVLRSLPEVAGRDYKLFRDRVYAYNQSDLPAIHIYNDGETIKIPERSKRMQPRLQDRLIITHVVVLGEVTGRDIKIDDVLDEMALKVENKIFEDPSLGRKTFDLMLVSGTKTTSDEGPRPRGALLLTFTSKVLTQEGQAQKSIINQ